MIIGNGNIASVLTDRDDVIFFASGVSDSSCVDLHKFNREIVLLESMPTDKHLVYFSSIGIYRDFESPYMIHKRHMESVVRERFKSYTIVRIEVIDWGKNENTIHNYFRKKIQLGEPVTIQDTHRYIVSKDEFLEWMQLIPVGQKNEMNIPGKKYHVCDIYKMVKGGIL